MVRVLPTFNFLCGFILTGSDPNSDLLSQCALITFHNISIEKKDLIYILRDDVENANAILEPQKLNRPVILTNKIIKSFHKLDRINPTAYVIEASDYSHFENFFLRLNVTHPNWHPTSKFLVLIRQNCSLDEFAVIRKIAEIMKNVNAYDFAILTGNQPEETINIFTWLPFSPENQCMKYFNITLLDTCVNGTLKYNENIWPTKLPQQILPKGCVLPVCAFHWPPYAYKNLSAINNTLNQSETNAANFIDGYHVRTVQALAQRYGLQVQYISVEDGARWGMIMENGTWSGTLGVLQSGKAQAAIGGALQTLLRFNAFDCSPTLTSLFMKFYLPLPTKLPHWKSMVEIFSPALWLTILVIYVGASIFIGSLSKFAPLNECDHFKSYMNCFLMMWRIAVGSAAYRIPRSPTVRFVFLLWLIYNFHVALVYTTSLLSAITTHTYSEPIKTIEELSRSNLQILVVKQFVQISNMMDDELKAIISKKFGPSSTNLTSDIERMLTKRDAAIFDPSDHFEVLAREKLAEMYTLDDFVRLNPGIYVKKGSIYLRFLDNIQMIVLENGMFPKWESDLIGSYKYKRHLRVKYDDEVLSLTLEEISGSFYILISGLVLAIVAFFVEKKM